MNFHKSAFVAPSALPRAGCQLTVSAMRGAPLVSPPRVNVSKGRQTPRMDLLAGAQVLAASTVVGVGSYVVLKGRKKSKKTEEKTEGDAPKSEDSNAVGLKKSAKSQSSKNGSASKTPQKKQQPKAQQSKASQPKAQQSKAPQPKPQPPQQKQPKEEKKKFEIPKSSAEPVLNPSVLTESVGIDMSKYTGSVEVVTRGRTKVTKASEERLQGELQWALSVLLDIDACDAVVIVNSRNKVIASAGPLSNNARDAGSVVSRVSSSKEPVIESAEVGLSVPFVGSGAKSYGCFPAGEDGVVIAIASKYAGFIGDSERSLVESVCSRIGSFPLANYSKAK